MAVIYDVGGSTVIEPEDRRKVVVHTLRAPDRKRTFPATIVRAESDDEGMGRALRIPCLKDSVHISLVKHDLRTHSQIVEHLLSAAVGKPRIPIPHAPLLPLCFRVSNECTTPSPEARRFS
jgi:hypothetical protein